MGPGERYLSIEQLRLGERLQVAWRKDGGLPWSLPMPRLVLKPLLENAVQHGISRLPAGGAVEITLDANDDRLRIAVRNPSLPPEAEGVHGAGHTQRSIGHRPGYAFGSHARMASGWREGYYLCEIELQLEPTRA